MMGNTIERARHRWREILPQLGIDTRFLTNKHGPCPLCGGRDRYRFDDRDGTGSYFCNQCGPGVGVTLIRKLREWDHKTVCDEIDKILGDSKPVAATSRPKNNDRNLRAIERALAAARQPDIVTAYLQRRGLSVTSPVLRGDPRCPYFDDDGELVGHFPAVVAPIVGPDGSLQSAHRIYDAEIKPRKKSLPPVNTIAGGAVRLFEPTDELGVAEGIETALAAHELLNVPMWAVLTANGVQSFQPPAGLLRLHVYADNDSNFTGQAAAYALAHRLGREHRGLIVEVHIPPVADTDWLDVLNGAAAA
jgi:putative DNA primase/helicase